MGSITNMRVSFSARRQLFTLGHWSVIIGLGLSNVCVCVHVCICVNGGVPIKLLCRFFAFTHIDDEEFLIFIIPAQIKTMK